MHFATLAAAAAGLAGTAAAAASQSICDKYTMALLNANTPADQYTVLTLLVKTVGLGNFTGPGTVYPDLPGGKVQVPGILAQNATYNGVAVNLLPYFDGSLASSNANDAPVAVNWLDGGSPPNATAFANSTETNQYRLLQHLTVYFGVLLGCSGYGMDGFPLYEGQNSMYYVHKYMQLSEAEFGYFVSQVGLAAASFGVTTADIDAAAGALNSTFGYRCAPPAAVVPNTPVFAQEICADSTCPLSPNSTCGMSTDDVVSGYVETMPASATALYTLPVTGAVPTGTGVPTTTTSSIAPFSTGAAAPRQTAAAGLLAALGLAAALF